MKTIVRIEHDWRTSSEIIAFENLQFIPRIGEDLDIHSFLDPETSESIKDMEGGKGPSYVRNIYHKINKEEHSIIIVLAIPGDFPKFERVYGIGDEF